MLHFYLQKFPKLKKKKKEKDGVGAKQKAWKLFTKPHQLGSLHSKGCADGYLTHPEVPRACFCAAYIGNDCSSKGKEAPCLCSPFSAPHHCQNWGGGVTRFSYTRSSVSARLLERYPSCSLFLAVPLSLAVPAGM